MWASLGVYTLPTHRVPGGLGQARRSPLRISGVLCQDSVSIPCVAPPPIPGLGSQRAPPSCPFQVGSRYVTFPGPHTLEAADRAALNRPPWSAKPMTTYTSHSNFPKYPASPPFKSLWPPSCLLAGDLRRLFTPPCPPASWRLPPQLRLRHLPCIVSGVFPILLLPMRPELENHRCYTK